MADEGYELSAPMGEVAGAGTGRDSAATRDGRTKPETIGNLAERRAARSVYGPVWSYSDRPGFFAAAEVSRGD